MPVQVSVKDNQEITRQALKEKYPSLADRMSVQLLNNQALAYTATTDNIEALSACRGGYKPR